MRENRNAIYVTLVITIVSLGLAIVFEYNEKLNNLLPKADFIINCLLGIFSGSILALITAVINYRVERKRIITELLNFTQCLILELMPLNNLFFEGGNFDSQKQIEIIESACDMLRDYIHLRPIEFHPFFQRGRLVDANKKVMDRSIVPYAGGNGKKMIADGKKIKKVVCPYCGHKQNIFYKTGASCSGLFFKCKNSNCRKEFEIRL